MKQYWLSLFPDTFLWLQGTEGLIYNTLNYSYLRFQNTGVLKNRMNSLLDIDSLYRVVIQEDELKKPEIRQLIDDIVSTKSGSLSLCDEGYDRPVSLKPELRVQDDIESYEWDHKHHIDGKIIQNLHRVVFYLNGSEYGSNDYFKQTIFPVQSTEYLELEAICSFVQNGRKAFFFKEIYLVGNLWIYRDYPELLNRLTTMGFQVSIYCVEQDFLQHKNVAYEWEQKGIVVKVLLTNIVDHHLSLDKRIQEDGNYIFIVTSEAEYNKTLAYTEQNNLSDMELVPLYTGNNLSFFKDYLYLTEEEILTTALSKREIFMKQALNVYSFGTIFIMPDGKVYANPNTFPIGKIAEAPCDIVYHEMIEEKSWFRIRDQKPCCDCIYQWLCPSPSNYELVIGQPNLCHIK